MCPFAGACKKNAENQPMQASFTAHLIGNVRQRDRVMDLDSSRFKGLFGDIRTISHSHSAQPTYALGSALDEEATKDED